MKLAWQAIVFLLVTPWVETAALAAPASAPPLIAGEGPGACQKAAESALRSARGSVEDLSFAGPPSVQAGTSDKDEFNFRGGGRYRLKAGTARGFSFSCNYNTQTGIVAGVLLRDDAVNDGAAASGTARIFEPDLSHVSPEACESAAAAALQRRHPKIERISFNSALRQLQQASADRASLEGQGDAVRVIGEPSTHFSYRCEFDPRNGRVITVSASD